MGGWWNALLKGQPPTPDVNPSGFRSATLMFAVAGLSRWFSWKQHSKAVSWAVSIRVHDCAHSSCWGSQSTALSLKPLHTALQAFANYSA